MPIGIGRKNGIVGSVRRKQKSAGENTCAGRAAAGRRISSGYGYLDGAPGRKTFDYQKTPEKNLGNMWECTGGSALASESSKHSAARELAEEVGVVADPEELELLDTIRIKDRFVDTYVVVRNLETADLTLQAEEVIDAKFVDFTELNQIWQDNNLVPRERFLQYREALRNFVEKNKKANN